MLFAGISADNGFLAWWIAFGPHGPRAETPPGEWGRVWLYTGAGVAFSAVLWLTVHSFARPPPKTMTKEWQEATNEYLKVSSIEHRDASILTHCRGNESIPFTVSAAKATRARVSCKASRRNHKESTSKKMTNRRVGSESSVLSLLQNFSKVVRCCIDAYDTKLQHYRLRSSCTELKYYRIVQHH